MKHKIYAIDNHKDSRIHIGLRNAYHQAGHAAAIYLINKQRLKLLPDLPFQIVIKPQDSSTVQTDRYAGLYCKYTAEIQGGRRIQQLPTSFFEASQVLAWFQEDYFRNAIEADIINLLAGPLTEAKYLSMLDGEPFNANLINLNALHYYGGRSDLEIVINYMKCFFNEHSERKQQLNALFLAAFDFINEGSNWSKITNLANFIRNQSIGQIAYDKVVSMLETQVIAPPNNPLVVDTRAYLSLPSL